jgi:hypothetical protein
LFSRQNRNIVRGRSIIVIDEDVMDVVVAEADPDDATATLLDHDIEDTEAEFQIRSMSHLWRVIVCKSTC